MSKYKHTLNLPKTNFSIKSSPKREEEILEKWENERLYEQIETNGRSNSKPSFVLHDGPPYANGHIHHGHILNKVLKDIVVKYKTMKGYYVPFVPGWDCHGLPIETAVEKNIGNKLEKDKFRDACREYASQFVDIQRKQFKRLGVLGQWNKPYQTMDYSYEAQTLRELAKFADAGLLYKDLRPVYWCPNHFTALAQSDIEHKDDHVSTSVFVLFPMRFGYATYVAAWTTTPWTLSVNRAIAYNESLEYGLFKVGDKCVWAEKQRGQELFSKLGLAPELLDTKLGKDAFNPENNTHTYINTLLNNAEMPFVHSDHVKSDMGTGFVHIAPAHGEDDFKLGKKYNLEIKNAINDNGRSDSGLKLDELNKNVIERLGELNVLLAKEDYKHKYPYSSRSHKPVITRATEQWFVDIDKPFNNGTTLRDRALWWLHQVQWLPDWGYNRIKGMIETKPDWCLSRQRSWGVPFVSFKCKDCGFTAAPSYLMEAVANRIEKEGSGVWFNTSLSDFGFGNIQCSNCDSINLTKGEDILDVWFDSGVSFACALEKETGKAQADLYLEGSDQHRGWFNSSLFCSLVSKGQAPYKRVLTHGFVVDEKGEKLAKSKGNFIDPFKIIEKDGVEVIRLWVAMSEFRDDVKFSNTILDSAKQTYHKIRNTTRYMLSNLYDFDVEKDLLPLTDMNSVDLYAVHKFYEVYNKSLMAYENYSFHSVVKDVERACVVDLSSLYFEIIKDRLYTSAPDSRERRSAQSALWRIVDKLMRLMAPILPLTMEDAWSNFGSLSKDSIHLQSLFLAGGSPEVFEKMHLYDKVWDLRAKTNAKLEVLRAAKEIGSSLDAEVFLTVSLEDFPGADIRHSLKELFGVSRVDVVVGDTELIEVQKAEGDRCQRCWQYTDDYGVYVPDDVCSRCSHILTPQ